LRQGRAEEGGGEGGEGGSRLPWAAAKKNTPNIT